MFRIVLLALFGFTFFTAPVHAGFFDEGGLFGNDEKKSNPISGRRLKKAVLNRTLYIETPLGTEMPVHFFDDGTMNGKAGMLARYLSKKRIVNQDRGTWWMRGNALCQKWSVWMEGKPYCFQAARNGRQFYWWSDDTGHSGNARVGKLKYKQAKSIEDLLKRYGK